MFDARLLKAHRQALARSRSRHFMLLEPLDALPEEQQMALYRALNPLISTLIAQELRPAKPMEQALEAYLRAPFEEALAASGAWATLLSSASPRRKPMNLVLEQFPTWWQACPSARRTALVGLLQPVGTALTPPVPEAALALLKSLEEDQLPALEAWVQTWKDVTEDMVRGAFLIARAVGEGGALPLLAQVQTELTPEKLLETGDGEDWLGAAGDGLESLRTLSPALVQPALELLLTLARADISSSFAVAKALPALISALSTELRKAWLEDALVLAGAMGVRPVRFLLKELPGLYARAGRDRVQAFVAATASVTEYLGLEAGHQFLERKTDVARGLLQG